MPAEAELAGHAPALRAAARALCRNADECEDLVKDTFRRAVRHIGTSNDPVLNVRAWLVAILRNVFIDRARAAPVECHGASEVDDRPIPEPDPQPPWASVTLADVRAASAAIDPGLREVFALHYLEGLHYPEIATRLSIPENTVASRLFRARKAIRDQLLALSSEERPP